MNTDKGKNRPLVKEKSEIYLDHVYVYVRGRPKTSWSSQTSEEAV